MPKLESELEAVLLFKNEPVSVKELSTLLQKKPEEIKEALENLQNFYQERGVVLLTDGDVWSFGTHPEHTELIEKIQKEEFSRDLGRAGLETLAVILYRSPISRREIDQIRGVNSGFILRALLIRGLVERTESLSGERSFTYKPTLKLFQHLGLTKKEQLPDYKTAWDSLEQFVRSEDKEPESHD